MAVAFLFGRTSEFNLRKLQRELKSRKLPVTGQKEVLIARLEEYEGISTGSANGQSSSSSSDNDAPHDTTATTSDAIHAEDHGLATKAADNAVSILHRRSSRATIELRRNELARERDALSLWRSPLLFSKYLSLYLRDSVALGMRQVFAHERIVLAVSVALLAGIVTYRSEGPHQRAVEALEANVLWYGWWLVLGIASSIGLGTGLHTFVLFLGPHIAHVTLTAYQCQTLDFQVRGPNSFACDVPDPAARNAAAATAAVTVWQIAKKVRWESFFWGMGTSVGELPPYFVARAAAEAGRDDQGFDSIEGVLNKPRNQRTLGERVQVAMYNLMQSLGFFGILLCASIPNPLFDLAGIVCGHFGVPFMTFFGATFLGKAVFKSSIQPRDVESKLTSLIPLYRVSFAARITQTISVILMLSEDILSFILAELKEFAPSIHRIVQKLLDEQVKRYQQDDGGDETGNGGGKKGDSDSNNFVGAAWNTLLAAMIGYFVLSLLASLATSQMKKAQEVELHALREQLENESPPRKVRWGNVWMFGGFSKKENEA
ncbi:hypothetical protein PhCBS80983_g04773 [Powellomyces hirtus]|uniref:SAP domain-containing protein n=1 Tax=Powellomyces hirtus TaxID=109895 RepID=A0A507DXC8_9FUNG|nr:hypothetical protein PhCBS80983_g04773 [Powellomyces hirtus]